VRAYVDAMAKIANEQGHLTGMLLIAMPGMPDPRFAKTVIYLCAHSPQGAMGLVVNQVAPGVSLPKVVEQLGIHPAIDLSGEKVHVGGPVETGRGFVLHSCDYVQESTLVIDDRFALTATVDVLKAIAEGGGPRRKVFALGYSGWAPGQLDAEIQANGWLVAPADEELVFGGDDESKWQRALARLGVDPVALSTAAGRA
jgi:putative transcriptional regulator